MVPRMLFVFLEIVSTASMWRMFTYRLGQESQYQAIPPCRHLVLVLPLATRHALMGPHALARQVLQLQEHPQAPRCVLP